MAKARKYTQEQVVAAVKESQSLRSVLTRLGLAKAGGNYQTIRSTIEILHLDTAHWLGQGYLKGKTHDWGKKYPLSDILVENSSYANSNRLRIRLISEGIFEKKCYSCQLAQWLNKPISLELEHINGLHFDNRLENLTLLCPNCHAQTPTYRGRNMNRADR